MISDLVGCIHILEKNAIQRAIDSLEELKKIFQACR